LVAGFARLRNYSSLHRDFLFDDDLDRSQAAYNPHVSQGGTMAENRRVIDCRRFPTEKPCSIVISGTEGDVLDLAVLHAKTVHGHEDSSELRDQIRSTPQDEDATSEAA